MSRPVVETARIALAPGRTEADLIAASATFQGYLDEQPGFLSRELLKAADGSYLDLVHWQDHAAAEAMMEAAMTSPACLAYFAVMDMSAADPAAGVAHFDMLARYGRA